MAPTRIYIAGPMRGIERYNFPAFDQAAKELRDGGFEVVSPAELDREKYAPEIEFAPSLPPGFVLEALARDIEALATCDEIYMLRGWRNSQGACAELAFAQAIGLGVLADETWESGSEPKPVIPTASPADRKARPVARGFLDYFPDAVLAVAHLSYVANEQHNPGQPMHWNREKSTDHADCIIRHLIDRGTIDTDGQPHSAKVAWRAMAMLQLELEQNKKAAA